MPRIGRRLERQYLTVYPKIVPLQRLGLPTRSPLAVLPSRSPLFEDTSRVMGVPVGTNGVPLYTDARHYAAKGIPIVLYGAGPRTIEEANAHRADERLYLPDLYKATEVVAGALAEILG